MSPISLSLNVGLKICWWDSRLRCFFVQNGSSSGALLIKNAQLKHAGRYTCTAQTPIDNVTASANLVVRGESGLVVKTWPGTYIGTYPRPVFSPEVFWSWLDVRKHSCILWRGSTSAVYSPVTVGRKQILSTEISLELFLLMSDNLSTPQVSEGTHSEREKAGREANEANVFPEERDVHIGSRKNWTSTKAAAVALLTLLFGANWKLACRAVGCTVSVCF